MSFTEILALAALALDVVALSRHLGVASTLAWKTEAIRGAERSVWAEYYSKRCARPEGSRSPSCRSTRFAGAGRPTSETTVSSSSSTSGSVLPAA
jgi:hypothetical protein